MLRKIVSVICVFAIIISLGYVCYTYIISPYTGSQTPILSNEEIINSGMTEDEIKADYRQKYPDINFPENMLLKYYPSYVINQDLAGWIYIPAYNIDYPIVQTNDNSYYLKHDFYKKYNVWGIPYFDFRTTFNPNSKNIIIYGHNSKYLNNQMFAPLKAYANKSGYQKAPIIECDTLFEEIEWDIAAVIVVKENDNFDYLKTDFNNEDDFNNYIYEINKRKLYDTGINIDYTMNLLTISTCYYSSKNAKLVLICSQK